MIKLRTKEKAMKATFLMLASLVMLPGPALAQQDYFRSADANGDGVLDKTEFQAFIDILAEIGRPQAQKVKAAGRYGFAFARVDENGGGRITAAEIAALQ